MLECDNNNKKQTGDNDTDETDIDLDDNEDSCRQQKVLFIFGGFRNFFSCLKVFPSSFSIAALIGAAAIRKQVVTKLRWNVPQDEEEGNDDHDNTEEENSDVVELKRRASIDHLDQEELSKKCKVENSLVKEPKLEFSFKDSPFLEQLKLAKCLFKENQNSEIVQKEIKIEEDIHHERQFLSSKTGPTINIPARHSSLAHSEFKPPSSSNSQNFGSHNKQSIVNSNSKYLDKVKHPQCVHIRLATIFLNTLHTFRTKMILKF